MSIELQVIRASDFIRLGADEYLDLEASKEALRAMAQASPSGRPVSIRITSGRDTANRSEKPARLSNSRNVAKPAPLSACR